MSAPFDDLDELAARLREHIIGSASTRMPAPVQVTIVDGSMQWGNGYVWGLRAGREVQVLAPGPTDVSAASTSEPIIVWAFPPNPGDPSGYYIMIGGVIDAGSDNRRPALSVSSITDADGGSISGSGTVTSVAMSVPSILSVSGSPITTTGTLAVSLATQAANLVFSGPTAGGAATPTFRSLVAADIPSLTASKISDFSEAVDDRVAVLVVAGTNMTITYNDADGTLTFDAAAGGAAATDELLPYLAMAM